ELPAAPGEGGDGAVEVVDTDGDVVHALAVLGEEARVRAALVERLDQLPEDAADAREREPPGGVHRLPALLQLVDRRSVELVDLPRPDAVPVHIGLEARLEVANDDAQL